MPLWLQDIEQAYNTLQELKGKIDRYLDIKLIFIPPNNIPPLMAT